MTPDPTPYKDWVLGGMKQLIICLMALAITLGVSCKKESNITSDSKSKIELKKDLTHADHAVSVVDPQNPPGEGPGTFPHNTGICNCGKYAVCHPNYYETVAYGSDGMGYFVMHKTAPGQTTFPPGATFPGNGNY